MSGNTNFEEARAVGERFFNALAGGDFTAYLACLSRDRKRSRGRQWLRERFAKFSRLQVQSWNIIEVLPQDPDSVWVRFSISYQAGDRYGEDELELVREGENWRIDRSDFS
jgi:hypothetical protein